MGLFKNIKNYYDDLKIETKFTVCIMFAVVMPFLVLALVYGGQFYNMVVADTIRNEQESAMETVPRVNAVLEDVVGTCERLMELLVMKGFMEEESQKQTGVGADVTTVGMAQTGLVSGEDVNLAESIRTLVENRRVSAIRIYVDLPSDDALFRDEATQGIFYPLSTVKGTYWHGIFQGNEATELFCPPFYMGIREKEELGDCAYIMEEEIILQERKVPCYIAVYHESEQFESILVEGISFPGSVSYIINERNAVIASSDAYLSGMYYIDYGDISEYLMSSNNFIERTILGEKLYVGFNAIAQAEWYMVTVTPNRPLYHHAAMAIAKFVVVCLLCISGALGLAVWQSRSLTSRISSLAHRMSESRSGKAVSMPEPTVHDEVGELIHTYNYMTERINQLMESQKKTAEELRIAEFNSLQAQMNPHFLYNTMDMINWMALRGQTAEISNAVQQLARFYKLTLSKKATAMSIEEELEHVSIYVELQNMRFKNAVDFVTDIPDELLDYGIPKLTLQPIVENAILHGIMEKEDKTGSIVITGWREDRDIILLVSDDGVGIPIERLPDILSGKKGGASKGTNIAVYNIHKRLKLLYGEPYGLHYASVPGQGTEVRIKIPAFPLEEAGSLSQ